MADFILSSVKELCDFLANPHAHEELEEPILVVSVSGEPDIDFTDEDIASALLALPAVTVLISEHGTAACFDIHLDSSADSWSAELDAITETVFASPQASVSLVQLLRAGESISEKSQDIAVRDALMMESWVYSMLQRGPVHSRWLAETSSARNLSNVSNRPANSPAILSEYTDDTLYLTLNRPEKRNAFNTEMRDCLVETLRAVSKSAPSGGIVLRGAGPDFCSGGDLDEFDTTPDPATAHAIRSLRNTAWEMHLLSEHIRAELHGACVGAGIELPAFAKEVTATEDAYFWLPEVRFGLVPGAGGTVSIPKRIGKQRTNWMALTNRKVDARTANAWGLIDEIV